MHLFETGRSLLSNAYPLLISAIRDVSTEHPDQLIALCALKHFQDLPLRQKTGDQDQFYNAVGARYSILGISVPPMIRSAIVFIELLKQGHDLTQDLQNLGPSITSSPETARDFLSQRTRNLEEEGVAIALLFMILNPEGVQYGLGNFLSAVQSITKGKMDWSKVVQNFDLKGISVDVSQFTELYLSLLSVARAAPNFDIQLLWSGRWQHTETQLSFVLAFLSLPPSVINLGEIQGLREAYDPNEVTSGNSSHTVLGEEARRDPTISVDAVATLFELVQDSQDIPDDIQASLKELVKEKGWLLVCSTSAIQKSWTLEQEEIMVRFFYQYLEKKDPQYSYVFACLWFHDRQWVVSQLAQIHKDDLLKLPLILDHAEEQGWMDALLMMLNALGIDLAALAHRNDIISFDEWAEDKKSRNPDEFASLLAKFLLIKAQDEMRIARSEQPGPRTVPLAVKTVDAMLKVFEESEMGDSEDLVTLERHCMQSYPRLINYGQGFDSLIEENGAHGNGLPKSCDEEMSALYKQMYNDQLHFQDVLEILKEYKYSDDPNKQDLFACMIHGLFDEFACFNEYPDGPLSITACLFGGIIRFKILTGLALRVGLGMILEAVRNYSRDASMYKFGLQAFEAFIDRLEEWPGYCQLLIDIPSLQGTSVYRKAMEVVSSGGTAAPSADDTNGMNGLPDGMGLPNGGFDDFLVPADTTQPFRAIHAERLSPDDYECPDEETQEKIVFFFNNVSEQNLSTKINDLRKALKTEYASWFATLLVEERAKLEPNLQHLYLDMLTVLSMKDIWTEVLRETYVSIRKIMNAESTMTSTTDRKNLKSLSSWLGSITIAQDRPIKHKNISFLDLLIEGFETERLLIVIPFTCAVLSQASKSMVFRPPNPWTVEILKLLMEIYNDAPDLKLNQKFEIEVLCKELGIHKDSINPSTYLRDRRTRVDEAVNPLASGEMDGLDQLALSSIGRTGRNARFSSASLVSGIPDLEGRLTFPPQSGNPAMQARLHTIVHSAIRRAIIEIIAPVVERSVTIATEATAELVRKDFVREGDEERLLAAARQMVRQLAGSLALVTCKEPLRMSMTNGIRAALAETPEAIPEGAVLMCVNDNLDIACNVIEQQAEERSVPEVEIALEEEVMRRRQHHADHPNEPYLDPSFSRWAGCIPEPYKLNPEGLNEEQLHTYVDFVRQVRGANGHTSNISLDNGRQLPDVLQEPFPVSNVPTPAEVPALPHRPIQQQQSTQSSIPEMTPTSSHITTNGIPPMKLIHDRVQGLILEVIRLSMAGSAQSVKALNDGDPILRFSGQILESLLPLLPPDADRLASVFAETLCTFLLENGRSALEIDVMTHILTRLLDISPSGQMKVIQYLMQAIDEVILNIAATVALMKHQLLDIRFLDLTLSRGIRDNESEAVDLLDQYLDALLLKDDPMFLRADFSESLQALGEIHIEDPDATSAKGLLYKLRDWGLPETTAVEREDAEAVSQNQLQYILSEWLDLCENYGSGDKVHVLYMSQVHQNKHLIKQEDMVSFLRLCMEAAVNGHETESIQGDEKYFVVDSVAKFVILMARHQAPLNGSVKRSMPDQMDSMLTLIVIIMNLHATIRGESFNQRVFFRLFSTILCEWNDGEHENFYADRDMLLVFAKVFLSIEPRYFPGFIHSWLMLISHRMFMPALLKTMDRQCWDSFRAIMEAALSYIGQLMGQPIISPVTKDLYRGVLRLLLIQHHDFPEFLAENHYHFCNIIPEQGCQLRNLVLSAYPSSFPELPDPFTAGLKVDRLEEVKHPPKVSGDYLVALVQSQVKDMVDHNMQRTDCPDDEISRIAAAAYFDGYRKPVVNVAFLHSLVLHVGQTAISSAKSGAFFSSESPQAHFLTRLTRELRPEARYHFLSAIANQLRYPNSHTYYFSYALLHLFGGAEQLGNKPQDMDLKQQITRVLLERLIVHRPHPWGLIITLLGLLKNPAYRYWEQPFILANPEVNSRVQSLLSLQS